MNVSPSVFRVECKMVKTSSVPTGRIARGTNVQKKHCGRCLVSYERKQLIQRSKLQRRDALFIKEV